MLPNVAYNWAVHSVCTPQVLGCLMLMMYLNRNTICPTCGHPAAASCNTACLLRGHQRKYLLSRYIDINNDYQNDFQMPHCSINLYSKTAEP